MNKYSTISHTSAKTMMPGTCSRTSKVPDLYLQAVPDLPEVFSKQQGIQLPPLHSYEKAIKLLSGLVPPVATSSPSPLLRPKLCRNLLSKALHQCTIWSSSSLMASAFYFVKKEDGSLCPYVHYQGLNSITMSGAMDPQKLEAVRN